MSPLDWSWVALSAALLVVGGAILGIRIGVVLERRRARRRRPLRRLPPTMLLPVVCSAPPPSLEAMRDHLRWTIRATPTERSRR